MCFRERERSCSEPRAAELTREDCGNLLHHHSQVFSETISQASDGDFVHSRKCFKGQWRGCRTYWGVPQGQTGALEISWDFTFNYRRAAACTGCQGHNCQHPTASTLPHAICTFSTLCFAPPCPHSAPWLCFALCFPFGKGLKINISPH